MSIKDSVAQGINLGFEIGKMTGVVIPLLPILCVNMISDCAASSYYGPVLKDNIPPVAAPKSKSKAIDAKLNNNTDHFSEQVFNMSFVLYVQSCGAVGAAAGGLSMFVIASLRAVTFDCCKTAVDSELIHLSM